MFFLMNDLLHVWSWGSFPLNRNRDKVGEKSYLAHSSSSYFPLRLMLVFFAATSANSRLPGKRPSIGWFCRSSSSPQIVIELCVDPFFVGDKGSSRESFINAACVLGFAWSSHRKKLHLLCCGSWHV